jgi:organic radical activating enzyme
MEIVEVDNNWRSEVLNIDLILGNYCNYKCWYCWPGSNAGTIKFPDLELLKKNISHLINYYRDNTSKRVFDIHFCGGEPTHWKQFPEFISFLKENFNCLISMTSNGSKKIDWWQKNVKYFDRIHLSCHHEFVNLEEYRNLCDYIYSRGVIVSVSVMMDPRAWDKCIDIVEYLKQSKKQWTIRYVEIIDKTVNYTNEQKLILAKHRARRVNLWFFWMKNKHYISKVLVKDKNGKKHKFQDNEILLKKLNNFYGWECTVGVNWINISMNGTISGTCNQILYNGESTYNIYDPEFAQIFKPTIGPTICKKTECVCSIETVMPKRKISDKKVISIQPI